MNTRKTLVSILMLVSVLLSACASTVTATQAPTLLPPTSPAASDSTLAGDPIPEKYLNVDYLTGEGKLLSALRLYLPSDPICQELNTQGNCFTIILPNKSTDPGVRGPVALINGLIAVKFQLCPFCGSSEIGSIEYFEPKEDGGVFTVVKCETKTGAVCNADVGTTWKPAPQDTTWQSPENASFHLPLTITHGPEWDLQVVINDVDLIYMGNPPKPQSEWWGPTIVLLNGAHVLDPAKVTDLTTPVPPLKDLQPIPDDFFAYVASIPGVKLIQGPDPITINGIQGSQIIVHTPPMRAMLWLKDDYGWHGGGPSGADPELKRQMVLLEVNGERILLEFNDSPEKFDERYPLVQEIFNTITFRK